MPDPTAEWVHTCPDPGSCSGSAFGACVAAGRCLQAPNEQPDAAQEPPADAAPTTAAPDAPDGSTAILGRALIDRDGDAWHLNNAGDLWLGALNEEAQALTRDEIEARYGPVREVLLVDPAAGPVLAAARQWARAWDADPFGPATSAAKARLAAAVDAAEAGEVQLTPSPADEGGTTEPDRRREWAAAYRSAAAVVGTDVDTPDRGMSRAVMAAVRLLRRHADLIKGGALAPWADQPDDAAPEPAGDGPGWDRERITELIAAARNPVHGVQPELDPEDADQVEALLADRDRLERELEHARADRQDQTERDAARTELAEVTAERDRLRGELDATVQANYDWATGVTAARLQAEVDQLRVSQDAAHDDLAAILRELGLGDHARPVSAHQAVQDEVLPAIRRLRDDLGQEGGGDREGAS